MNCAKIVDYCDRHNIIEREFNLSGNDEQRGVMSRSRGLKVLLRNHINIVGRTEMVEQHSLHILRRGCMDSIL